MTGCIRCGEYGQAVRRALINANRAEANGKSAEKWVAEVRQLKADAKRCESRGHTATECRRGGAVHAARFA